MSEQPAAPSPDADGVTGGPRKLREWVTSTVLIVFTVALGLMCVLVLSCTLTQTRMSSIVVDGVNISIWKLDDIRKQWSEIRDQILEQSDGLSAAESQLSAATKTNGEFDLRYRPARTEIDSLLQALIVRIGTFDAKTAEAMREEGPVERIDHIEVIKDDLLKAHPDLAPLIADIEKKGADYKPIDQERIKVRRDLEAKKRAVSDLQARLVSLRTSLDGLFAQFSTKPLDGQTRTRVENAMFELYSGKLLGRFVNALIITPPDILTLGLVILMGVLGSALQMTHALFKRNRVERAGAYFLRLSVGAITALVIFIVAKAGVPVIADASRLGGDAPINPYFVSFLAIISGLMSENAILSVQTQGARFFAQEVPPDPLRWARFNLRDAFAKANRNPENVKRLLNADDSQFDAWISGKEAMPGNAQTMIAGVLDMPRRDLFTDLPPDEPREAGGPAPAPAPT
jgi:hypothetical protein